MKTTEDPNGGFAAPLGSAAATAEVVSWAQCVLTALNVGDVQSGSKLHLKLREVMIAYRASIPEPPNDKVSDPALTTRSSDMPKAKPKLKGRAGSLHRIVGPQIRDPDIRVLRTCVKALDRSSSSRMLRANIEFLADRYLRPNARTEPPAR